MSLLSEDAVRTELLNDLNRRVEALREKGVMIPDSYPPANLDPAEGPFRGFLGEVRVTELLCERFTSNKIQMLEPSDPPTGNDIDIVIHTSPPYYLQVKDWLVTTVNVCGEAQSLEGMVQSARKVALDDVAKNWDFISTFSYLRIVLDDNGQLVLSEDSETRIVPHSRIVHVFMVEIDIELLKNTTERRLNRGIKEALKQLPKDSDGIVIPVLNLIWFPHDQAFAYVTTREILKMHKWQIGGVLLLTNDYENRRVRLIGVANPNAPEGRGMKEDVFNPGYLDENMFSGSLVFISWTPPEATPHIIGDLLMVESTAFAKLRSGLRILGVRYDSRKKSDESSPSNRQS